MLLDCHVEAPDDSMGRLTGLTELFLGQSVEPIWPVKRSAGLFVQATEEYSSCCGNSLDNDWLAFTASMPKRMQKRQTASSFLMAMNGDRRGQDKGSVAGGSGEDGSGVGGDGHQLPPSCGGMCKEDAQTQCIPCGPPIIPQKGGTPIPAINPGAAVSRSAGTENGGAGNDSCGAAKGGKPFYKPNHSRPYNSKDYCGGEGKKVPEPGGKFRMTIKDPNRAAGAQPLCDGSKMRSELICDAF